MFIIDAERLQALLDWKETIDALERMFVAGCDAPRRQHYTIALEDQQEATMLLMPAWVAGHYNGLKLVNVYPGNVRKNLPTIMGTYLLMDGATGELIAQLDGAELTARRTVCASALASKYLSRPDAYRLLIVGSGRLARYLGFAHQATRPLTHIDVWARNPEKAAEVIDLYREAGFHCRLVSDLQAACGEADIISCATLSKEPLIQGRWLPPGTHLDLIGGFTPAMRESDDEAVNRSSLFVDTRVGALAEAGDLLIPMEKGVIRREDIVAELSELASGSHPGRIADEEITLFKSVGAALEDLAAAIACYEKIRRQERC